MNERALPEAIRAVLLDVEGTVGDLRFVADTLFPYARTRLASFLAAHAGAPEVAAIVREVAKAAAVPEGDQLAVVTALEAWSDASAKVKPLKDLQGLIWAAGYRQGELRAHVYDDVPSALHRWKERGLVLAVYSSGSVLAQRLYFAHSTAGDLSACFSGYFDTSSGTKGDPQSYRRIADYLALSPHEVAFFSDAPAEIAAARAAGVHAIRIDRTRDPSDSGRDPSGTPWAGSLPTG